MTIHRTADYSERENGRYWWFHTIGRGFDPPALAILSDEEWDVMDQWYRQSGVDYPHGTGECNIPPISMLHALIGGSGVRRVVQLGHFIGFSTLLLGFELRRTGAEHGLLSFDIDPACTAYTQGWVDRANLGAHVRLKVGDSAAADAPAEAKAYLGGAPQLVFIDSSHQYKHTLRELELWYPALQPGGLILLHDVSRFAATFDGTGKGGVAKALPEWGRKRKANYIMLNANLTNQPIEALTYGDGCGLGIVQKPL